MAVNPQLNPSFRYIAAIPQDAAHPTVLAALDVHNKALVDLQQAFAALVPKVNANSSATTTIINNSSSGGGGTPTPPPPFPIPGLGGVNDQSGNTSYTIVSTDNGSLVILNDSSPVAVTLDSTLPTPYFVFFVNLGAGTVTLTPSTGTINGNSSLDLPFLGCAYAFFDGTNWTSGSGIDASQVVLINPIGNQFINQLTGTVFSVASDFLVFQQVNPGGVGLFSSDLIDFQGIQINFSGTALYNFLRTTSDIVMDGTEGFNILLLDASSNAITVTLPPVASSSEFTYTMKRADVTPSAFTVTINTPDGSFIDGNLTINLDNLEAIEVICDGTNWNIIAQVSVGFSGTVTTAALTLAGAQGSQTFVNGILKSQVQAT